MALYDIIRACGHTESVQIYGTDVRGQRAWHAARLAEQPCSDCARTARDAVRAHEQKTAAADNAAAALPALTGSERQIAWAETIRSQAVRELDELRAQMGQELAVNPTPERVAIADKSSAALDRSIAGHTDARWWIDHRSGASFELRREAAAILKADETGVTDA